MNHLTLGTIVAVAAGPCVATSAGATEEFITGAAIYEVELDDTKAGTSTDLVALEGTMTATLTRDCEAYRSVLTLDTEIFGPDGEVIPMVLSSDHVEDETSLTFSLRGEFAMVEIERAEGVATREDGGLSVSLTEPESGTFKFDGDVLFPMAMTRAVIRAAEAGERFVEYTTYDGSGFGREHWLVSVVIAEAEEGSDDDAAFAEGLGFGDMSRWRMTFNYFAPEPGDEMTPSFSTDAIVYKNGFSQAAVYDFGQFAMALELVEFKPIAPEPCP